MVSGPSIVLLSLKITSNSARTSSTSTQALVIVSLNFFAKYKLFIVCGLGSDKSLRNFEPFPDATTTDVPATDVVQPLFPGTPVLGSTHAKSSVKWLVTYEGFTDFEGSTEGSSDENGSGMPSTDMAIVDMN